MKDPIKVSNEKTLMKLCKYLATLSSYENLDTEQPIRVYTDMDGELLAFEGILYKIHWSNNQRSFHDLAENIDHFATISFAEFRSLIYAIA